jgi:hypothetical protein
MAGSGRRVFSPGEVLTASNTMNYFMDQTVMNFAGTAARGSAIGTAVAEGMVSYLADSNDVQVYDGSAWNDLAYISDVNARAGLARIIAPTVNFSGGTATANSLGEVSFTSVTSISLNNVFSSAYTSYRLVLSASSGSVNAAHLLRLRSSGTDVSGTGYTWIIFVSTTSASNRFSAGSTSSAEWSIGGGGIGTSFGVMDLTYPAQARPTMGTYQAMNPLTTFETRTGGFVHNVSTSYDGFTILPASGNMTGTLAVYGYA